MARSYPLGTTASQDPTGLRLGSAAGDASAGVAALRGVSFTGKHRVAVRNALHGMADMSSRARSTALSLGETTAVHGRPGIRADHLRQLSAATAPMADTLQAIRNLVYRP